MSWSTHARTRTTQPPHLRRTRYPDPLVLRPRPVPAIHVKTAPARVRDVYGTKRLTSFALSEISDDAPAVSEISAEVEYEENGVTATVSVRFRLINEDAKGLAVVRGNPESKWTILNWDVI